MWRSRGIVLLTAAVVTLASAAATAFGLQAADAAPTKAPGAVLFTHACGPTTVTELLVPPSHGQGFSGIKSWGVDASGALNGVEYLLKSTELRAYTGDFTTEPVGQDPVFMFSKSLGERVGQGAPLQCSNRDSFIDQDGQTITVFFTFELIQLKP